MVYFTKYTIIGHFIDLSMHKKVNDKPTDTNWIESLNLTTYLHVSSIFTFYIIIFTSIFVWKTNQNDRNFKYENQ